MLPAAPLAHTLGFQPLPPAFFAALAGMVVGYLALIEFGKRLFYGAAATGPPVHRPYAPHRHLRRRATYFSTASQPTPLRPAAAPEPERATAVRRP